MYCWQFGRLRTRNRNTNSISPISIFPSWTDAKMYGFLILVLFLCLCSRLYYYVLLCSSYLVEYVYGWICLG